MSNRIELFNFNGTVGRGVFFLCYFLPIILLGVVFPITLVMTGWGLNLILKLPIAFQNNFWMYYTMFVVLYFTIGAMKRLRDAGRPVFLIVLLVIPFVNLWILFELFFRSSKEVKH